MILTITMNPSIDISYPLKHFVIGDVNRVEKNVKTAGGKGLNVTRVINLLKKDVMATGIVGGYFGKFIEDKLNKSDIKHNFLHINGETRCCIAILHDNKVQTEILEEGPLVSGAALADFNNKFDELLQHVDLITISGSLPRGIDTNFYTELVKKGHGKKIKVLADTSGEILRNLLLGDDKPDLIKPNETELQDLINKKVNFDDINSLIDACNSEIFTGVNWICISLGSHGAFIKHNDVFYRARIPKIKAINPVGSGDSTLAGLAVAMEEQLDDVSIIKTGMTTGVLNAMERKTGYVNIDNFKKIYNQIVVEKINY